MNQKSLILAAIPVCLSSYYLTQVAPGLVPIPEGMTVPFPPLTAALSPISPPSSYIGS